MTKKFLSFSSICAGFYNSELVYRKKTLSPNRKVTEYELEYFLQSSGISFINEEAHPIVRGNVLLAVPGYIRHSLLPFRAFYVHFTTNNAFLRELLDSLPALSSFGEDDVIVKSLFVQISEHCQADEPIDRMYGESRLLELIYVLANRYHCLKKNIICSPVIRQGMEYIDKNYKYPLKLEDIAKAVGLTPVYFHQLFLKNTGETPHEYLMGKRLDAARKMLSGSDMELIDIAAECGFSSQSYFNAVFKKYCGITPLKYRQNAFDMYQL